MSMLQVVFYQLHSINNLMLNSVTVVLVIFATRVKKCKANSCLFWLVVVRLPCFLDQFVLFIQWCKLPTNWINRFTPYKGSHLYLPCRSVCDRDQNWIKRSKPFWGADQGIKVTSELLKSTIKNAWLNVTFDPWKSIDQEPQKETIKRSSTLFANQKTWSRSQTLL